MLPCATPLKRVVVPGGFWREFDYGGAGWLTRRTVQTGANETETTTYTYDPWGRLRLIDYPRSADVMMGYDGESRRVWVQGGIGRREYSYDAWGRVTRQQGCCGNQAGISVVAVEASYDPAGRRREIRELTEGNFALRTIATSYDDLGRVQEIISEGRSVVYNYDPAGRLREERYPYGIVVCYSYYDAEEPTQRGFLKRLEFGFGDCSEPERGRLLGYEYRYDALGRVVWSKELPSGDELSYSYTPSGRLESEARTGDLAYYRVYSYDRDGRRAWVLREDGVRGFSLDVYAYDAVSGRLTQVEGTDGIHRFSWYPSGRLARWEAPNSGYAREYCYDGEGRLVQIQRDYGAGDVRLSYEAQYNGDGFRVWDREWVWETQNPPLVQEYRYVCGIDCGRLPLRVYRQEEGGWWVSYEWYTRLLRSVWYSGYEFESVYTWLNMDYPLLSSHLLVGELVAAPWMVELMYDQFGVFVGERFYPQKVKKFPHYLSPPDVPNVYIPRPIPRIPELPENPIPGLPNPTGPINVGTGFVNAMCGTMQVIPVARSCNDFVYNTGEGASWCIEHPKCMGNAVCCVKECARILGVDPDEVINDWVDAYKKLWGCIP